MKWFFPSWNGDFRLEPISISHTAYRDGKVRTLLIAHNPTLDEQRLLGSFLKGALDRGWAKKNAVVLAYVDGEFHLALPADQNQQRVEVVLDATVTEAGEALLKLVEPQDRTLTAVAYENGVLRVAEARDTKALKLLLPAPADEPSSKKAAERDAEHKKPTPKAATTVKRPTSCCPNCIPGSIEPASEVLLEFLTPSQHRDWAAHRAIIVKGGTTGHRYRVAHRNTKIAQRQTKIAFDLDDQLLLHFHDWTVPPEEEVLATKIILEHREHWLRHEASALDGGRMRFKNPHGDGQDGISDTMFTDALGRGLLAAVKGLEAVGAWPLRQR